MKSTESTIGASTLTALLLLGFAASLAFAQEPAAFPLPKYELVRTGTRDQGIRMEARSAVGRDTLNRGSQAM